ncbi:hypothetical protein OC844_000108 [Tilletia horrida]|nr:hypothetical protein OC844_000108 [Tilletia horrida]
MAAPALLQVKGNKTFAPIANLNSELALIQCWQAVSKASQFLEQGKRLENLSWRLWSLQALGDYPDDVSVLNRGRVAGHLLNREKGAPALLPPTGHSRAKCCKIDPTVACVHKKPRSNPRTTFAAGPSVPLRTNSHTSSEGGATRHDAAVASSSRLTLDVGPSTSSNPPAQLHQKPAQPLWPISYISPNVHLAPSPFLPMGHSSTQSMLAHAGAGPGPGAGGSSATQIMLSALIDSLLSAGVAPSVAAQALQHNPAHLMASLNDQNYGSFGVPSLPPSHPGTVPSTPMDWSASASVTLPQNYDDMARASLADIFAAQPGPNGTAINAAFGLADRTPMQQPAAAPSALHQQEQQPQPDWFNLAGPSGSTLSPIQPSFSAQDLDIAMASSSTIQEQVETSGSTADATSDHPLQASLPELRRINDLRQQMQLSSPLSSPVSAAGSPQSELAPPVGTADSSDAKPVASATKLSKKKASLDSSALGIQTGSGSSNKGKAKATVASASLPPEGSSGRSKDSAAALKRGSMQTTSSSSRKAASTVASPAAPPDQAPPQCSNCGVKKTPLWRRCGEQHELLCNACGLYWAMHKTHRPDKLKHHRSGRNVGDDDNGHGGGEGGHDSEDDGPETLCSNCGTSTTPLWRKDREGNTVCNACGLFMKLHGSARPVKMRADVIKKRVRYENPTSPTGTETSALASVGGPSSAAIAAGGQQGLVGSVAGAQGGTASTAMDLGTMSFANANGGGGASSSSTSLPSALRTPPLSAGDLLSSFATPGSQHDQGGGGSGSGSGSGSAGPTATVFAPFHPGSDTLGRLTTTTTSAAGSASAGTPLSAHQAHTPTAFAQQQDAALSAHHQQQQRYEQEQWAQAAGFLLPHEPVGDGFNFGQALWGCDPGVIGNWHTGSSAEAAALPPAAGSPSADPTAAVPGFGASSVSGGGANARSGAGVGISSNVRERDSGLASETDATTAVHRPSHSDDSGHGSGAASSLGARALEEQDQ